MAKTCPKCGSSKIISFGWQVAKKKKIPKYRCNKCYQYFVHPKYSGRGSKDNASKPPVNGSTVVLDEDNED